MSTDPATTSQTEEQNVESVPEGTEQTAESVVTAENGTGGVKGEKEGSGDAAYDYQAAYAAYAAYFAAYGNTLGRYQGYKSYNKGYNNYNKGKGKGQGPYGNFYNNNNNNNNNWQHNRPWNKNGPQNENRTITGENHQGMNHNPNQMNKGGHSMGNPNQMGLGNPNAINNPNLPPHMNNNWNPENRWNNNQRDWAPLVGPNGEPSTDNTCWDVKQTGFCKRFPCKWFPCCDLPPDDPVFANAIFQQGFEHMQAKSGTGGMGLKKDKADDATTLSFDNIFEADKGDAETVTEDMTVEAVVADEAVPATE